MNNNVYFNFLFGEIEFFDFKYKVFQFLFDNAINFEFSRNMHKHVIISTLIIIKYAVIYKNKMLALPS